jgi:iron complex outermembrane receptor protein
MSPARNFRFPLSLTAIATALAAALPAHAQSSSDRLAVAQAEGLEEVVVLATKRATNLQDTAIAMSVMSAEALEDRHVKALYDLADGSIPGLRVATFEARQSALTIGVRGIVPLDANQPAREQGVGIYIDGVYLGRQHGLNASLLDIDHIEVLKGPAGTLFGRNTEGGAVSIVTKAPTGEFGIRANAGISNYDGYDADLHIDLPKAGNWSFKIDAVTQYQDATTKDPLPDSVGWNYFDRSGGRLGVRWEPSDKFTADYSYDTGTDKNTPFYSQLLNYNPLGLVVGPASGALPAGQIRPLPSIVQVEGEKRMEDADIGVPQQASTDDTDGHALTLKWRPFDNDLELRSISSTRSVSMTQWDNSGGAHRVPVFVANGAFSRYSLADLSQDQKSQEFQAVGTAGRVDYVGGLYYFEEDASDDAATPSTNVWNATGTGYTIGNLLPTQPGFRSIDRASEAHAKSYAVYGQAIINMRDDRLHLTLGGRSTTDEKNGRLFIVNNAPTAFTFGTKDTHFDPTVTLAWDASDDVNLYAKYSTGYRSGGASSRSLTYRSFGPEEVDAYEIGAKTELFNHNVRLDFAAYAMNRTGSQIDFSLVTPQPNGSTRNTLETINAPGTTNINGLEIESTWRATDKITVTGAYAYTETDIPPTLNPFTNQIQPVFIVFTPKNAANVGFDYETPMGGMMFRVHLDGSYADATQTFDQTPVTNDKSFLVNSRIVFANLGVGKGSNMTFALWARNLLDNEYVYRRDPANRATLGDYGNFGAPRTFGVSVNYDFQ